MVETWRVVLASGEVRSCVVEGHDLGAAEGVRWRVRGAVRATTGWSARAAVVDHIAAVGLPAVEILAPGEPTRAEAVAAVAAERDDLRAIIETRNAENALLREQLAAHARHTDAAVDGVRAMLPAALDLARREGRDAALRECRDIARAEQGVPVGAAHADFNAVECVARIAARIEAIPLDAPGGA